MKIKFSVVLALLIIAGVAWWMLSGTLIIGGRNDSANATPPPAERVDADESELFRVKVDAISAFPRQSVLDLNGLVEASAKVVVKSETSGMLLDRIVEKGNFVSEGDVLCLIDKGVREAKILEARASLNYTETELESTSALKKKGFSTSNRVASLKANVDSAKARLDEALQNLERTTIKAPIGGRIEEPIAEVGSLLNFGDACATILNTNPMLAVGQVSEREVGKLSLGMNADVRTISGETLSGIISYISHTADANTRTFKVEVEVPNPRQTIREGVSALIRVALPPQSVHKINSSSLTLDDNGFVGVRTVDSNDIVEFHKVEVVGGEGDGLWITGLPEEAKVIVVGQEYVIPGQKVIPVSGQ